MDLETLKSAQQALALALNDADEASIRDRQTALAQQLETIAKAAGLKGALKIDPKWANAIVEKRSEGRFNSELKQLASQITAKQSFQDPSVQNEISRLSATPAKKVKETAAALGHKIAGAKSNALLTDLLEKLTGVSSVPINRELVTSHLQTLKSLFERSVDSLPDNEIKTEMKQLKALPLPELIRIAEGFGVERPGKKKPEIVKLIESKITATYRAKMANRV